MKKQFDLEVIENPSLEQYEVLSKGIRQHAQDMKGIKKKQVRVFFVKEDEKVIGGVVCTVYLGALQIKKVWVAKENRNQGIASLLMCKAEEEGKRNNCRFATLSTCDWEALEFYLKSNYTIEFKREGYDKDSVLYYLKKELS